MDSKPAGHKANLKQYRPVHGKWQFVPVVKVDGKPKPQLALIDGKPESWKGGGKFHLEWYEDAACPFSGSQRVASVSRGVCEPSTAR